MAIREPLNVPNGLMMLMAVQLGCAAFFVVDAVHDHLEGRNLWSLDLHLGIETIATLSLLVAIGIEAQFLKSLLNRKSMLERSLDHVSAEVNEVIIAQFEEWRLSPAESDIAMFLVKGLGTQEIAELRGSAEGTIKAHFNAIFRKAGVHSRAELLSALIDRLLGKRLDAAPKVFQARKSG